MASNYKEILDQAKKEKERVALESDKQDLVNLCVRVPKSWRTQVKTKAVQQDLTLEKLVVDAVNDYLERQGW